MCGGDGGEHNEANMPQAEIFHATSHITEVCTYDQGLLIPLPYFLFADKILLFNVFS